MRVISGIAGGRKLKTPENYDIRPTTDNVKESMFNILQFDIEGRRVLDMFAGCGQLGIECLSRGAAEVVFLDRDRRSIALIKENIKTCGLSGAKVIQTDSIAYLGAADKFDLIFMDPPYDEGLYAPALAKVNAIDILNEGGIIMCESRKDEILPEMLPPYHKKKEYRYGRIKLTIYIKDSTI